MMNSKQAASAPRLVQREDAPETSRAENITKLMDEPGVRPFGKVMEQALGQVDLHTYMTGKLQA